MLFTLGACPTHIVSSNPGRNTGLGLKTELSTDSRAYKQGWSRLGLISPGVVDVSINDRKPVKKTFNVHKDQEHHQRGRNSLSRRPSFPRTAVWEQRDGVPGHTLPLFHVSLGLCVHARCPCLSGYVVFAYPMNRCVDVEGSATSLWVWVMVWSAYHLLCFS